MKKKYTILILIIISSIFCIFLAYYFKNFAILILSLFLISTAGFFLKTINDKIVLFISSILFTFFLIEILLFIPNSWKIVKHEIIKKKIFTLII